ncbi:MAG: glycosyltransferase [Chitinophagaceae bacterium]|nr:glycosyltransferase [Chitinophagaceae bacterium]MCW5904112.1 glycosyltransferase [Chitinophagaceae bacterium]
MWLTAFLILITILYAGYTAILLLYRKWFLQLKPFTASNNNKPTTHFSIIIPARNEDKYIKNCLLSILQQSYPASLFEIIVIDDHSTDETATVVQQIQQQYHNVQLIKLADELGGKILNSYKKKAIENAISYAKGEWIITTDADCIAPTKWLITYDAWIQQHNTVFVAAPVAFINNGSLLQAFQYIDFMSMQGITAASVNAGFHNMCNGANLAYRKDIFLQVNGFKDIDNIASGDDMLLMNKIRKQHPKGVSFLFSKEAIVTTYPMPSWKAFYNQRIRWASKAEQFKTKDTSIFVVLIWLYFFNATLFILPWCSFFTIDCLAFWILFILLKTLSELSFALPVAKFFGQPFVWWFPFMQPLHILYIVMSGWLGKFGNYQWKGRNVK